MASLVIFGAGDIARVAATRFEHDSAHSVAAFTVDKAYRHADEFCGKPLVDFERLTMDFPPSKYQMFVATGYSEMNRLRARKCKESRDLGYVLASYISTKAILSAPVTHGDNVLVLEGCILQSWTTIGNNVTLWSGCHIGHDSTIEDDCFLAPEVAISGRVHVGAGCFLGINSTVRNGITLGSETLIGAGAVITQDTAPRSVHVAPRSLSLRRRSLEITI